MVYEEKICEGYSDTNSSNNDIGFEVYSDSNKILLIVITSLMR